MTEREMLEWAAKAAGMRVELVWFCTPFLDEWQGFREIGCNGNSEEHEWNPLNDDGDALRLAVKLELFDLDKLLVDLDIHERATSHHLDPLAATRRAIVRAAAEIGKAMP